MGHVLKSSRDAKEHEARRTVDNDSFSLYYCSTCTPTFHIDDRSHHFHKRLSNNMKIVTYLLGAVWLVAGHVLCQDCAADGTCDTHERCSVWKEEGECIRNKVRAVLVLCCGADLASINSNNLSRVASTIFRNTWRNTVPSPVRKTH